MNICIVEDNRSLLDNLVLLLGGEPGFHVAGAFASAEAALASSSWAHADVLLVDIDLPGCSGIDLIRSALKRHPAVLPMVFTISENRATVFAALKAGALGYVLKGSSPRELVEALLALHAGGAPMSPKIARKVIHELQGREDEPASGAAALTLRERDILRGIAWGKSYKDLAEQMGLSPHTIHSHIKRTYEKLHAANRTQALAKARSMGMI